MKTTTKNILFILNLVLLGICISMMLTLYKSNKTAFGTKIADAVFGGPVVAPTEQGAEGKEELEKLEEQLKSDRSRGQNWFFA